MTDQFKHLDDIARDVSKGIKERFGVLSTGEAIYVALAANDVNLLKSLGYTIAEALARLGPEWTNTFIDNWRFKGDPRSY